MSTTGLNTLHIHEKKWQIMTITITIINITTTTITTTTPSPSHHHHPHHHHHHLHLKHYLRNVEISGEVTEEHHCNTEMQASVMKNRTSGACSYRTQTG